jgi:O-antigen/teichoic acid export membrane protein
LLSLAARSGALAANVVMLRRTAAWLRQGIRHARWSEIRRLFVPAAAFLGIPAGNAAAIYGTVFVLHQALGPVAVALYSTTRTLTRAIVQSVGLLAVSSWPEMSRYFGAGRIDVLRLMFTHGTQLSAIAAAGLGALIVLAGPFIMTLWTGGRIVPDHALIAALTAAAIAMTMRAFPETILLATNRHIRYSAIYVLVCIGVMLGCYPVAKYFGLPAAAVLIAAGDAVLMAIAFRAVIALLGLGAMPWREILTSRPPVRWLLGKKPLDPA